MSHSSLLCAASEVDLMHCILPLIHVGRELGGWLLKKTYLHAGSLSSISNFTDRSFHAQIMWFGISYGRKGIEKDIHGKLFIYSSAFGILTYFPGHFLVIFAEIHTSYDTLFCKMRHSASQSF